MSISTNDNRRSYSGDGQSAAFAFAIPFTAATDLVVILRASDGTETLQSLGMDYSVSGAGNPAGGTVTFGVAPPSGMTVVIYRDVPLTQPVNLQDGGPLPAATANGAFDRLTMMMQRLYERVARGINLRETDTPGSGRLDAGGNEITNIADGTQPDSAASVQQLTDSLPALDAIAAEAAASATEADASAAAAAVSSSSAAGSASGASASAVAAASSASSAAASATSAGNSATAAAASAAQSRINWKGQWVTASAYALADAVQNGGSAFFCTTAHTSGSTTQPGVGASWQTVWSLMAAKGAAGAGAGDMLAATYDPQGKAADAFNRTNHTGTQAISTVTNLQSSLDAKANLAAAGVFSQLAESVKTAAYTVVTGDAGTALIHNSATAHIFTLPTVASTSGMVFFFRNIGTGDLTLDGNGSETIEGVTTLILHQGCSAILWSNGTVWKAIQVNRVATTAEAQAGTATGVSMDPATTAAAVTAQMKLVQRGYAEYTTYAALTVAIPGDDTIPTSSEGTQILSISYIPKSATNTIRLTFLAFAATSTQTYVGAAIFQGTTCLTVGGSTSSGNGFNTALVATIEVAAGSTSSRIYSVRAGSNAGTAYLNGLAAGRQYGGVARAVLLVEEFTP